MKWMIWPVDIIIKDNIYNKLFNERVTQLILFIWFILYNYTDKYVKAMQSNEFHYYKLNWT